MENNDIFVRTLLTDKVKLRPNQISSRVKEHIVASLKHKFEGMCSYHGFIKPDSIELFKYSLGTIQALSLNGDVEYVVNYHAEVCNPSIGSIVHTKVVNLNKFGLLAHTGIRDVHNKFVPILEIVIAKNMINAQNDKNVEDFKIGDEIHVEIMGKKFELTDKKISAVARIMTTADDKNILDDAVSATVAAEDDADADTPDAPDDPEDGESTDSAEESEEEDDEASEEQASDEDDEDDDNSQLGGDLASDGFFSEGDDAVSDFMSDAGSEN